MKIYKISDVTTHRPIYIADKAGVSIQSSNIKDLFTNPVEQTSITK